MIWQLLRRIKQTSPIQRALRKLRARDTTESKQAHFEQKWRAADGIVIHSPEELEKLLAEFEESKARQEKKRLAYQLPEKAPRRQQPSDR